MNKWQYHAPYVAGLMFILAAIAVWGSIVENRSFSLLGWISLLIGVIALLSLIQGWRRVAVNVVAFFYRIVYRTAPHVQAAGQVVGHGAQRAVPRVRRFGQYALAFVRVLGRRAVDNPWATAAILFALMAVRLYTNGQNETATVALLASVGCGIIHRNGTQTFANHWKGWWVAISVLGTVYAVIFGYGWMTITVFVASTILAAIFYAGKEEEAGDAVKKGLTEALTGAAAGIAKLFALFVQLLFGKWGHDLACLAGSAILGGIGMACVLVPDLKGSTLTISGIAVSTAFATFAASASLFVAAWVLGVKDRLVK